MSLASGDRLGPYEVLGALGAGGMGEVYRARDTKLGRDVALKILPDAFATDPERLARFEREAKTLASVNHPHIAQIYGFEQSGNTSALVMELVDGEDLSRRIARGPIPLAEALLLATQIAEALEAAHEQGIVHRDLKPANVKIRDDGTVKVLDFGLAKAFDPTSGAGVDPMDLPTITGHATKAGVILGTAAYMSPEQAKSRTVDRRADLWAFGAVLYEMLTGRRAFIGDGASDTIARVLMEEPDWSALPASTPGPIRTLLRRCLEKDRRRRLDSAAAVRFAIEDALAATPDAPASRRRNRWAPIGWTALGLVAAVALWIAVAAGRPPAANPQVISSTVDLPSNPTLFPADRFAVSPDGQRLAFVAPGSSGSSVLWIRPLSSLDAQPLTGTGRGERTILVTRQPPARVQCRRQAEAHRRFRRHRGHARRRRQHLNWDLESSRRHPLFATSHERAPSCLRQGGRGRSRRGLDGNAGASLLPVLSSGRAAFPLPFGTQRVSGLPGRLEPPTAHRGRGQRHVCVRPHPVPARDDARCSAV